MRKVENVKRDMLLTIINSFILYAIFFSVCSTSYDKCTYTNRVHCIHSVCREEEREKEIAREKENWRV